MDRQQRLAPLRHSRKGPRREPRPPSPPTSNRTDMRLAPGTTASALIFLLLAGSAPHARAAGPQAAPPGQQPLQAATPGAGTAPVTGGIIRGVVKAGNIPLPGVS